MSIASSLSSSPSSVIIVGPCGQRHTHSTEACMTELFSIPGQSLQSLMSLHCSISDNPWSYATDSAHMTDGLPLWPICRFRIHCLITEETLLFFGHKVDPEVKARASGSEREMGQARARENFSRSEREK